MKWSFCDRKSMVFIQSFYKIASFKKMNFVCFTWNSKTENTLLHTNTLHNVRAEFDHFSFWTSFKNCILDPRNKVIRESFMNHLWTSLLIGRKACAFLKTIFDHIGGTKFIYRGLVRGVSRVLIDTPRIWENSTAEPRV